MVGRRNRKEKLSQSFFSSSSKIVSAEPSSESLPSLNLLIMLAFRLCNQWLGKKPGRNNNREKLSNMFCLFFQNAQQLNLGKPSSPYQPRSVISQSYSLCSTLQCIARDCVTATRRLERNMCHIFLQNAQLNQSHEITNLITYPILQLS